MEEESEIIFSLSKGACQSKSDCEAPREEDIEYFSDNYKDYVLILQD